MIALALFAAAPLAPYQQALVDCMSTNAAAFAVGNTEPADSVIKAAETRCRPEWDQAALVWRGNAIGNAILERLGEDRPLSNSEREDRDRAYVAAFEAVVKARESKDSLRK